VPGDRFDIDPSPLPVVRRLEAAGFRDWPSQVAEYDRAWLIRLTPHHPAKRLNSINPLDIADHDDLDARIDRARRRFAEFGRTTIFRISPLASPRLGGHLDALGWPEFGHSQIMHLGLSRDALTGFMDQIPMQDIGRFIARSAVIRNAVAGQETGLQRILSSISGELGLFLVENDGGPLSCVIAVRDNDLAGLFEIGTAVGRRRGGHARSVVGSALKWAHAHGARRAWLQVEQSNEAAIALYHSLGFRRVYDYHYRSDARP
jgi:GNAT superfamily N-acetyltransferase